ncbi:MAG: HEAT repeat domain-containing protein [Planctomycetes bacterium]|nr:HEAT repeat domain-containing protein [Planctomycetota bacterium]
MRRPHRDRCALVAIALGLTGCWPGGTGGGSLYARLQSEDDPVRIQAAVEAGRTGDREALPFLVEMLADASPAVRLAAIGSLRRITGWDFGYQSYGDEAARREAIGRWRQWLEAPAGGGEAR